MTFVVALCPWLTYKSASFYLFFLFVTTFVCLDNEVIHIVFVVSSSVIKLWMNEASSCESTNDKKKGECSCLPNDPWWCAPSWAFKFPALPKKRPRNPGDLINLHFPPAGVCHVPISLCGITSLHFRNENWYGKTSHWVRLTQRVSVCVCVKKEPACMHAWANRWIHITDVVNISHECEGVI